MSALIWIGWPSRVSSAFDDQAGAVFGHLDHLPFGQEDARVLLNGLVEVLGQPGGAHVLVDDEGLAVGIVLAHVAGLFQATRLVTELA
jgi:hypothetical protein